MVIINFEQIDFLTVCVSSFFNALMMYIYFILKLILKIKLILKEG